MRTIEQVHASVTKYCKQNELTEKDEKFLHSIIEDAFLAGDISGWNQAVRLTPSLRQIPKERNYDVT